MEKHFPLGRYTRELARSIEVYNNLSRRICLRKQLFKTYVSRRLCLQTDILSSHRYIVSRRICLQTYVCSEEHFPLGGTHVNYLDPSKSTTIIQDVYVFRNNYSIRMSTDRYIAFRHIYCLQTYIPSDVYVFRRAHPFGQYTHELARSIEVYNNHSRLTCLQKQLFKTYFFRRIRLQTDILSSDGYIVSRRICLQTYMSSDVYVFG